jgi:hypothetical protein
MNHPLIDETAVRMWASRCGAYCEDGKPVLFDDFDIVKFANLVFKQGYREGKGVDLFKEAA